MDIHIAYFNQLKANNYKYARFELVKHIRSLQRRTHGMPAVERAIIFNMLMNSRIDNVNFRNLLYSVIPATTVKEHEIKDILIWVFINLQTQRVKCTAILIWISVLLHFNLCDKKAVKKFYPQFIIMFRAGFQVQHVCKIIYDLTTPADITRLIVQEFLLYWKKYPRNKPVGAVLSRFKHYRADLVPEKVPQVSPKAAFSSMIPQDLIYNINEVTGLSITDVITESRRFGNKKEVEIIPPMLYLHFKRSIYKRHVRHYLYEFESVQQLAANQSYLEPPHNAISLIADDRGHLVLACEKIDIQSRFASELEQVLYYAFITNDPLQDAEAKKKMLGAVINFLEFMQRPVPVVSTFTIKYILIWDGRSYEDEVLHLLPWLSFVSNEVYMKTFQPAMESLFLTISMEKKCRLVSAMGNCLINFVVRSKAQKHHLFGGLVEKFSPEEVISNVANFILNLCANEMFHEDDQYLLHTTLDFFDLVCTLSETNDVPLKIPIPASIAYRALLSKEATSLTRLCSIFLRLSPLYKETGDEQTNHSIDYMLGMFKDFYWSLQTRKHLKGENLIFDDNSQQSVLIKKIIKEKFLDFSKHLALSLLCLQFSDKPLNAYGIANTAEVECKSIAEFLFYYEKFYLRRRRKL